MKMRIFAVLCCAAVLFSFSSCKKSGDGDETKKDVSSVTETVTSENESNEAEDKKDGEVPVDGKNTEKTDKKDEGGSSKSSEKTSGESSSKMPENSSSESSAFDSRQSDAGSEDGSKKPNTEKGYGSIYMPDMDI